MLSSALKAVAVVLLLQSTCWIGVWALHDITVEGGEEVHWDYSDGAHGPAHWHELKPEWAVCKTGKQQSPIAINLNDMVTEPGLGALNAEYRPGGTPATIVNEGHAVVVEIPSAIPSYGRIMFDDWTVYRLQQFHYHMPSEHRILNQSFPLEIHMVYKRSKAARYGSLYAVVSFLFVEGAESEFLAQFSDIVPSYKTPNIKKSIGNITLLEMGKNYGRYIGSLTTPPCREDVIWTINLWNFPTVSKRQLQQLRAALPHTNNRPTFPSTERRFRMWP